MAVETLTPGSIATPDEDKYDIADEWLDLQLGSGACSLYAAAGRLAARSWGYENEYNVNVLAYAAGGKTPSTPVNIVGLSTFVDENSTKAALHDLIDAHDVEFWPASL